MWRVLLEDETGEAQELPALVSEGRPVDRDLLGTLVTETRGLDTPVLGRLLSELERGDAQRDDYTSASAVPGLTALESYAEQAASAYLDEGRLEPLGQGLAWTTDAEQPMIAWHERTAVLAGIPPDARIVTLIWEPERGEDEADALYQAGPPQRFLDYRLYVGEHSTTVDGDILMRQLGRRRWGVRISHVASAPALLVGKVVRWLGPSRSLHESDRGWRSRLEHFEQALPQTAARFPTLGSADLPDRSVCVYIHGTRSCCLPALEQLRDYLADARVVRFEHDTFRAISENTEDLCREIRRRVNAQRVLLIGHSRGGLVARLAAAQLRGKGLDVDVMTFGTPHHGTPLVGRGLDLIAGASGTPVRLGLLARLDDITTPSGATYTDPVSAALSILTRSSQLPEGIRAMAPGSEFLRMLAMLDMPGPPFAIGGACTLADAPGGFRAALAYRGAAGVFAGEENDLVVGLTSSTLDRAGYVLGSPCSHGAYFRDEQAIQLVQAAF